MSRIKIDQKIVKYRVQKPEAEKPLAKDPREGKLRKDGGGKVVWMHEKLERPEVLIGSTYKIKTPVSDHAMYVTINDIVLNEGTEYQQRRPFEIFLAAQRRVDCRQSEARLRALGVVEPQLDAGYLERCLGDFRTQGILPAPRRARRRPA